jgi:hypothetical protein
MIAFALILLKIILTNGMFGIIIKHIRLGGRKSHIEIKAEICIVEN